MKRPAFWLLLGLVSLAATAAAVHYFPQAFSIVALDITMDREHALAEARAIMARDRLGPAGLSGRRPRSRSTSETQTFVELEGGGKEAFTRMLRDGLYAAYTWRVRHFTRRRDQRDAHPVHARRPAVRLRREAEGGCAGRGARRRRGAAVAPKRTARARLAASTSRRSRSSSRARSGGPGGRVDHTFTYERAVADPQRGPLPPAARRLRRSADRGHATSSRSRRRSPAATRTCDRRTKPSASARPSAWCCSTSSAASASACSSCCAAATCCGGRRRSGASPSARCRRWRRSTSGR